MSDSVYTSEEAKRLAQDDDVLEAARKVSEAKTAYWNALAKLEKLVGVEVPSNPFPTDGPSDSILQRQLEERLKNARTGQVLHPSRIDEIKASS